MQSLSLSITSTLYAEVSDRESRFGHKITGQTIQCNLYGVIEIYG